MLQLRYPLLAWTLRGSQDFCNTIFKGRYMTLWQANFKQLRRDRQGRRRWVGRKQGWTEIGFYIGGFRYRTLKKLENKDNTHRIGSYKVKKRSYKVKKMEKWRKWKEKKKKRLDEEGGRIKSSGRIAPRYHKQATITMELLFPNWMLV